MNKKFVRNFFAIMISFSVFISLIMSGCKPLSVTRTFFAADTICSITVYGQNSAALDGAVALCNRLAVMMDADNESSDLTRLNREKSSENPNEDLYSVIKIAKEYAQKSNGVFDPTIRSFTKLWDFSSDVLPSSSQLQEAAKYVGFENLDITENKITLNKNCELELGAIAKGYISQKLSEYLKEQNVTSAIINLGGNVTLVGNNNGEDFSVGIQKPFEDGTIAAIYAEDCSVVTSGIYQRYIEKDGVLWHHLLNSKTGLPEQNSLNSVTVIAENGTDADALSTLCFLLGMQDGKNLIETLPDTEAVFLDRNNNITLTSGLEIENNIIKIKSDRKC